MKHLSIIVPMYNVAPYVERCIRSLENQDIPKDDYELICINDGSPDDCGIIVRNLQKEFKNIILIDQENQGVSRARNNGIDRATGKFLIFIDPDDYVEPDSFYHILKKVEINKAHVSCLGYTILDMDAQPKYSAFGKIDIESVYSGIEAYSLMRGDGVTDPDRMVAMLFDADFLKSNQLRYLPDVPYLEDGELIARIFCLAQNCVFDRHPFYRRTTRPGSATHSNLYQSEKASCGFLIAAGNLKKFQDEICYKKEQKRFLNQPILKFVLFAIHSSCSRFPPRRLPETIKKIKELKLMKISLDGCNRQYLIYGKAYNLSPYIGELTLISYFRLERIYNFFRGKKNN